ncbi:kinetochore-associated protein NSL1 homolog isoform X2 [Melanotaenia boesemani]|uniref:kinetochore-associated protein NSL1 homolog isoform X2 n=1 Tax=Melanotaenia boesemani TaxID=1250792 RepID=UPI001C04616B|nr:kinetochore-associated protein NSL1 homolog isoform X2 [Melanotaenia boesemani]
MEQTRSETGEESQDYRVQTTSKRKVVAQISRFKAVLSKVLDGQPEVAEETKRLLLEELLANFEAAVQANVVVNGQSWEDAPDVEDDEAVDLQSLLDDTIVETTRKRRTYPKKILPHVVHTLKAERKVMGLYKQEVKPQEIPRDLDRDSAMKDLSAGAPVLVKQAIQVIKSINTLLSQAEGLCGVLNMKPSHASQEVHREVLNIQSDALPHANGAARNRQPIKRAIEEAAASKGYMPRTKKPDRSTSRDESE